jgi:hypothetical protein
MKRKQISKMTKPDDLLERRFQEAVKLQPGLSKLKHLLLSVGGERFYPPGGPEYELEALLKSGFAVPGPPAKIKIMEPHECHRNVAKTWKTKNHGGLVAIATGYALTGDCGMWLQHSWGVMPTGIFETTVPRERYFGTLLFDESAERFASRHENVQKLFDQITFFDRQILDRVLAACQGRFEAATVEETLQKAFADLGPLDKAVGLDLAGWQRFVDIMDEKGVVDKP